MCPWVSLLLLSRVISSSYILFHMYACIYQSMHTSLFIYIHTQNFYSMHICTPARAAFLSGRNPMRYGLQHYVIISSISTYPSIHIYISIYTYTELLLHACLYTCPDRLLKWTEFNAIWATTLRHSLIHTYLSIYSYLYTYIHRTSIPCLSVHLPAPPS